MDGFGMDRRALMRAAILLVGGTAAGLPRMAMAQDAPPFFAAGERRLLDAVCATMIPATDTPGAVEAGVPAFIDRMMTAWASDQSRSDLRSVLAALDKAARDNDGKGFAELAPEARTARLAAHDEVALFDDDAAYTRFKRLVLQGYYLSETGATQELRYELAPGVWEPGVTMTADTRAWAVG